jgi:hypothetical protein
MENEQSVDDISRKEEPAEGLPLVKPVYERPDLKIGGRFSDITRGSGSTIAFDYYVTDYP